MAQPGGQGVTYLIIWLQVHVRELQQFSQLSGLVVVENGLLGRGKGSEARQTLLPDGEEPGLLGSGSSCPLAVQKQGTSISSHAN